MKAAAIGLVLAVTAGLVAWWLAGAAAGRAAVAAGLVATALEVAAARILEPALEPPFERALKRWAYGFALRMVGVAGLAVAVVRGREWFPPLPTVGGFLGVLLPLMAGEMATIAKRLRTVR